MTTATAGGAVEQQRPPTTVWVLTALFALFAVFSVAGSLVFAFPMGGVLGTTVGIALLIAAVLYGVIVWRLRSGSPPIWGLALGVPLVHQGGLAAVDLARDGRIPSEDYPFLAATAVIVILLLLPATRRFFRR